MNGFRSYFDLYPDQVSQDSVIEPAGERTILSVWNLTGSPRLTDEKLVRSGEEIVSFDDAGMMSASRSPTIPSSQITHFAAMQHFIWPRLFSKFLR